GNEATAISGLKAGFKSLFIEFSRCYAVFYTAKFELIIKLARQVDICQLFLSPRFIFAPNTTKN
ncbi:hypothetical protein, partial [Candidatus Weimeria sp. HCP3S3_B5]|uniref:hypothetical protein n=1 Tax=Candidatus Weimeria sp. HCP3S3_B5 TaxID=3438871 RepID=UPI003F8C696C